METSVKVLSDERCDELSDERCDERCDSSSVLDLTVENVVQVLINNEKEIEMLSEKKQNLQVEMENLSKFVQELEKEQSELDGQITVLKLRNLVYQKEHMNLRNAITIVKFQIEKIREGIEKAKANQLKDLEDFEKSVDKITEKFRSGPDIYNRKTLLEKIAQEKEKRVGLLKKIEELNNSILEFHKEKGLRARKDEFEDLLACILPGSELHDLIAMSNNLDKITCEIKKLILGKENLKESEVIR